MEYQVETLHKYGLEHPESGLAQKVKGISFSTTVDVRDPFTKMMVKKPIKPFMVDQLSIQLERERLILSDFDTQLWRDLENYSIERYDANHNPIFTSRSEHTLDALMLAILAFVLEFPRLSGTIEPITVARNADFVKLVQPDPLKQLFTQPQKEDKEQRLIPVPVGSKGSHKRGFNVFTRGGPSRGIITRKMW